jgi:hypothetical protein
MVCSCPSLPSPILPSGTFCLERRSCSSRFCSRWRELYIHITFRTSSFVCPQFLLLLNFLPPPHVILTGLPITGPHLSDHSGDSVLGQLGFLRILNRVEDTPRWRAVGMSHLTLLEQNCLELYPRPEATESGNL